MWIVVGGELFRPFSGADVPRWVGAMVLEFRLLGDTGVWRGGERIALGSKQRAVLVVLAFHANTVVTRSDIVRLAWGGDADDPPMTIDRLVADYVSRLRTAFRVADVGEQVRLVARSPGYVLETAPETVDWLRFRDLVNQARAAALAGDRDDAADLLRRGLGLWSGSALADIDSRSLGPLRTQMNDLRLAAAEDLANAEIVGGRGGEVVDLLTELASNNPGRERLAALLIRALLDVGRRDDAVAVYQRTRAHLTDNLGVGPTAVLNDAYRAVLHGRTPTPARAPARDPSRLAQLPADTASFTGRHAELAQLLAHVVDTATDPGPGGVVGIYAVDGMGGIGKTTLAVHAAHRLAPKYPDGCLFLDLHGYTHAIAPVEPEQALQRLLRALGVPGEQIPDNLDDQAALYRSRLAGKRMLIVLDNARAAEQVRPLLPAEAGCLVLVTSRRRLTALDEAQPLSLDVLPVIDGVALFVRISGPGRTTGQLDAVERVTELCGRLPLAVRIAAARLRARPAWTVSHLGDRLADQHNRLDELNDGERGVAAAFTLSYHDLTADQQRTFRLLGLHPGADIDLYATAALTGLSLAHAGRILEELLDAHLLLQATAGRYRFHDLIRVYAARLTDSQDRDDLRKAALTGLFDHYLATAAAAMDTLHPAEKYRRPGSGLSNAPTPSMTGPETARAWLDAERANLVAVCAHAAAQGRTEHAIRLAATLFGYLHYGGYYADGLTIHTHARQAAHDSGDRVAEAHAETNLGLAHDGQGRSAQAVDHIQQALVLFREIGDRPGTARALSNLGLVYWGLGPYRQAADHVQHALAIYRELGDRFGEADALDNLGAIRERQDRDDQAAPDFRRALTLFRELGDRVGEAGVLGSLGCIHSRQGRHGQALDHHRQAIALCRQVGYRVGEAQALNEMGVDHRRQGDHAEAINHHRQALALFREIGHRSGETEALNGLGESLHTAGHPTQARTHHIAALALAAQTGDRYEQARAHTGIARAHHAGGDHQQARHHWQEALARYTDLDVPAADIRAHLAELDQATADRSRQDHPPSSPDNSAQHAQT